MRKNIGIESLVNAGIFFEDNLEVPDSLELQAYNLLKRSGQFGVRNCDKALTMRYDVMKKQEYRSQKYLM